MSNEELLDKLEELEHALTETRLMREAIGAWERRLKVSERRWQARIEEVKAQMRGQVQFRPDIQFDIRGSGE